jgi:biopolymer transport protein ExbB
MAQDAATAPSTPPPGAESVATTPAVPEVPVETTVAFDPSSLPTPESMLASNDSLALAKMGFSHLVAHSDVPGLLVLAVMAVMSVLCWYYIFYNAFRLIAVRARIKSVVNGFWDSPSPKEVVGMLSSQPEYEPFSKVALEAYDASEHYGGQEAGRLGDVLTKHEFVSRRVAHSLHTEIGQFDSGLTLLATVGSTAPFVGLFGTVWGIYHALINIGMKGKATLDVVAGPVGEALIMTCIGLGVAIPAVLAYNYFVQANRNISGKLQTFAKDLLDFFATGERVRAQRYGSRTDTSAAGT